MDQTQQFIAIFRNMIRTGVNFGPLTCSSNCGRIFRILIRSKARSFSVVLLVLLLGCSGAASDSSATTARKVDPAGPVENSDVSDTTVGDTSALGDDFFSVSPFELTEGEDFSSWEFDLKPFDGVDRYVLRFTQGDKSFEVARQTQGLLLVTGDDFAAADFDYGIEASLELFHQPAEDSVATYKDLFPLPVPSEYLTGTASGQQNIHSEYDAFPTDDNGHVLVDEDGEIIGATPAPEFEKSCAVLDPRLRISEGPVYLSGFWPKSSGVKYTSYLWVPKGWELRTTGTITPVPWKTNVEAWNYLPLRMTFETTTGAVGHFGPNESQPLAYTSLYFDVRSHIAFDLMVGFGGLPVSRADDGSYVPVGVRAFLISQYQYDLVVEVVPRDAENPAPYLEEPCLVFQNIFVEPVLDLDIFVTIAEVGATAAQVTLEFTPGYDCYDAAVNGVDGWNAVGCTADLVGAGSSISVLKAADNVQFVARRGDDVVGAVKGVDGARLADDITRSSAKVCGSFGPEVGVLLADGSTKPISAIEAGENVLSWDSRRSQSVPAQVSASWSHQEELATAFIGSGELAVTADHVVWNESDKQWQAVSAIDSGDHMLSVDGEVVHFKGLRLDNDELVEVFDLAVDDFESFFVVVGGATVLVHNMNPACEIATKHGGKAAKLADDFPELRKTIDDYATTNGKRSVPNLDSALRQVQKESKKANRTFDRRRFDEFLKKGGDDAAVLLKNKGLKALDDLCIGSAGGAYELINIASGEVVYVGETNDFSRRLREHETSSRFEGMEIEFGKQQQQNDYDVRRGLEQDFYNQNWGDVEIAEAKNKGSLNRQRPIASKRRTALRTRASYANAYKKICNG